jgi:GrpB-like predicted nucleotidyltransferase (UPF0157 family)
MILGVPNDSVFLAEYSRGWIEAFETEREKILQKVKSFGTVIEHIGSTSIPGILAKPIIDIAVGIQMYEGVDQVISKLSEVGYSSRGFRSDTLGIVLELKNGNLRTHCVHLLNMSTRYWDDSIYFRDILRSNSVLREQYQNLKVELSKLFAEDRSQYTKRKNAFVDQILKQRREQ